MSQYSKNGESPGPDGLSNEFYIKLPANAILYMYKMFKKILNKEKHRKIGIR